MREPNLKPQTGPKSGGWWKTLLGGLFEPIPAGGLKQDDTTFREAAGVTVDADEDSWRPLSGDTKRDLSPMTQAHMQKMAAYLWESNLLANRLIELPLAYLLGEGVNIKVEDKNAQAAIKRFWNDPINQMDLKLPKKVRELAIFGEQCWPVFVNEMNGHVRLGYLDPALIARVAVDPDNTEQPIGIETAPDSQGRARRYRVIINGPEEVFTRSTRAIRRGFSDGECFFFRVNDLTSGRRGRSDLLAQADWLDTYEQFMFGEADRAVALRSFIWDVTLKGASPEQVKTRAKDIHTPPPGSVRVHNDSEVWEPQAPSLGANDLSEVAKLFRNHILGGATLPTIFYGGSQDANRAVGQEMAEATVKVLTQRQRYWGYILTFVAQYVIRSRFVKTGKPEPDFENDPKLAVSAEFPEIQSRDTTKYAAALAQVTSAVVVAIDKGLMTEELGLRTIEVVAERLGVQFDPVEELEKAREERKAREDEAAARREDFRDLPGEGGGEGDQAGPGPTPSPAQPANDEPVREAIDQLRDRVQTLAVDLAIAARQPLREAQAPVSVNLPEIQAPKPVAVEKEVLERDERDLIKKTRETFIYEEPKP